MIFVIGEDNDCILVRELDYLANLGIWLQYGPKRVRWDGLSNVILGQIAKDHSISFCIFSNHKIKGRVFGLIDYHRVDWKPK